MTESLSAFLAEGASIHPDNPAFAALASNPDVANSISELWFFLRTGHRLGFKLDVEAIDALKRTDYKDMRLIHAGVSGVRRYAADRNASYYGINLSGGPECDAPVSAVLLGQNGVGKTSLFTALEMAATGQSSVASAHGFDGAVYSKNRQDLKARVLMHTVTDCMICDLESGIRAEIPYSFFCSVHDVNYVARNDVNTEYILRQLGRGDYFELERALKAVNKISDNADSLYKLARSLKGKSEADQKIIKENIGSVKRESKRELGVSKWDNSYEYRGDGFHVMLRQLYDSIQAENKNTVRLFVDYFKEILPRLMSGFVSEDEGVMEVAYEPKWNTVNVWVRKRSGESVTPRQFFNTFRLKLYVVALKLALSACAKIVMKMNFPNVLDDVFDASDFITKRRIEELMNEMVAAYSGLDQLKEYPLQVLFLSQDDIVAESSYRGFARALGYDNVKMMRMFAPEEADAVDDTFSWISDSRRYDVISVADEID